MLSSAWSIVLSGGEGRRMQPFIREWLGAERPKQYCTFSGTRSMLRHTWDRARELSTPERVVTVIGRGHRRYLGERDAPPGPVLEQPTDCGTAPGVFLPLTLVAAREPDATVLLLPADHFVFPERRFLALTAAACRHAAELPGRLVLLAARARWAETEFGWIVAGPEGRGVPLRRVEQFVEKPPEELAARLLAEGALWSTMVMAARVDALWELGERLLPEMMRPLRALLRALRRLPADAPSERLAEAIARAYRAMPSADLSRDLVQRSPGRALVQVLDGVEWCDWGQPERVEESLRRLGAPVSLVAGGRAAAEQPGLRVAVSPLS
jgi:mannose-1-phosphate guanylyltransferase